MIDGHALVNGTQFYSDTARFFNATKLVTRRGSVVVDPNLNPGRSWLITTAVGRDLEGENYYRAVPETPILKACGETAKYPVEINGKLFLKLNKRWIIAWYPAMHKNFPLNPSNYIFSIWKKEWEVVMLRGGSRLVT